MRLYTPDIEDVPIMVYPQYSLLPSSVYPLSVATIVFLKPSLLVTETSTLLLPPQARSHSHSTPLRRQDNYTLNDDGSLAIQLPLPKNTLVTSSYASSCSSRLRDLFTTAGQIIVAESYILPWKDCTIARSKLRCLLLYKLW